MLGLAQFTKVSIQYLHKPYINNEFYLGLCSVYGSFTNIVRRIGQVPPCCPWYSDPKYSHICAERGR